MGKDAYIEALGTLHAKCGRPTFQKLHDISKELAQRDPALSGGAPRPPELSTTALSEILAGKRKKLPPADWVASFVLSCHRYASAFDISLGPGSASLSEWQAWRLAAQATEASKAGKRGKSRQASKARRGGAATSPLSARVSMTLPPHHLVFVADHAPYGSRLLASAAAGHPDAIYRVAMLLGTDRRRSEDALSLLVQLAAAGHQLSIDLLDDDPGGGLAPDRVAARAYDLADAAESAGRIDEAAAFYEAAARGGVAEARLKHARVVLERRGEPQAAAWLSALTSPPGTAQPEGSRAGDAAPASPADSADSANAADPG